MAGAVSAAPAVSTTGVARGERHRAYRSRLNDAPTRTRAPMRPHAGPHAKAGLTSTRAVTVDSGG